MQTLRKFTIRDLPGAAAFQRIRGYGSPYRHTGAFLAGVLLALAVTAGYVLLKNRAEIWRQAHESALNTALGLETASSVVLAQPTISLRSVDQDLAGGDRSEQAARLALAQAMRYDPMSVYMGAVAPDGSLTVLARDGRASHEVVEALRTRIQAPQPVGLGLQQFLHVPGRTEWFMPITLAAEDASGAFVFALVSARQLIAGGDVVNLLPDSYVAFATADGRRLLRYWKDSDVVEVNGSPLPEERLDTMRGNGQGSFEMQNAISGQVQIAGYAHSTVLPMYVASIVPTEDLNSRWMRESTGPLLVLVMGTAAVVAYALRLRRALNAEAHVREQALTDGLTGLPNRRALDEDTRQALAIATRNGREFAVVMADVDFFKAINDSFGHHAGDAVLAAFARRLAGALRAQDRAYRYGGEEFCVLLPATDADGARVLAERLREAVALPSTAGMHAVTASFGVAVWEPGDDAELVLDRADEALYRAKAGGRNRVEMS
jgi:diguanylate cyclase (GGDEF)-like protein